jgi:hypothetical protein
MILLWERIALGLAVRILKKQLPGLIDRARKTMSPWDDRLWRAVRAVVDAYDQGGLLPPEAP